MGYIIYVELFIKKHVAVLSLCHVGLLSNQRLSNLQAHTTDVFLIVSVLYPSQDRDSGVNVEHTYAPVICTAAARMEWHGNHVQQRKILSTRRM